MVARRLSDSNKRSLVASFKAGETTAKLADAFGCSPNTVSRTVKALLSDEEYAELKALRAKGALIGVTSSEDSDVVVNSTPLREKLGQNELQQFDDPQSNSAHGKEGVLEMDDDSSLLALDDADDFSGNLGDENTEDNGLEDEQNAQYFQELVPLNQDIFVDEPKKTSCQPFSLDLLPSRVYMLVEKAVELDARPLKDFPELGLMNDEEQDRKAIYLFSNQRSAKRQCGRSQRVIQVPDSKVFALSVPYLVGRGITRLILEGTIISLDT